LPVEAQKRAMEVRFNGRTTAQWDVTFGSENGDAGRHFFFSGGSNIPTTFTTTVCPCEEWPDATFDWSLCNAAGEATLLSNNLGGKGPTNGAEEIRYGKVAHYNGADLDLVVSAVSDYAAFDVTRNNATTAVGLSGCFGAINVLHDTSVRLRFEFQNSAGGGAADIGPDSAFAFSIYDIDSDKHAPADNEEVAFNTNTSSFQEPRVGAKVQQTNTNPYTFVSSTAGNGEDNAEGESDVADRMQRDRSVGVLYDGRSSWEVTLTANGGHNGRNFLFHGCRPGAQWLQFPQAPFGSARDYPDEYSVE